MELNPLDFVGVRGIHLGFYHPLMERPEFIRHPKKWDSFSSHQEGTVNVYLADGEPTKWGTRTVRAHPVPISECRVDFYDDAARRKAERHSEIKKLIDSGELAVGDYVRCGTRQYKWRRVTKITASHVWGQACSRNIKTGEFTEAPYSSENELSSIKEVVKLR